MGTHTMILPYEVYTVLEERLGNKEDAVKIAEAIRRPLLTLKPVPLRLQHRKSSRLKTS